MSNNSEFERIYNLSPLQEGMLFHSLLNRGSKAYFEQSVLSISGKIDIEVFKKSLNILIARHEVFRTNFVYEKIQNPKQVVFKSKQAKVAYEDISMFDENKRFDFIQDYKEEDIAKGFDLTRDILIRVSILKTGVQEYKLIWSFHHIIMDGWCISIVIKEFFQIYQALQKNNDLNLSKVNSYSEYIKWIERQDAGAAAIFWKRFLDGYGQNVGLTRSTGAAKNGEYNLSKVEFSFGENMTKKLETIARNNQVTLNTIFQTIWAILLFRYNNIYDVVFGTVVSGRPSMLQGVDKMVGLFVNTIPVRIRGDKNTTFLELLKQTQEAALIANKYDFLSLSKIQSGSDLKQELFDHIIAFESYPIEKEIISSNNTENVDFIVNCVDIFEQTNYDLNIIVIPGTDLSVKITYNNLIYDTDIIANIERHLKEIAENISNNLDMRISEIDILSRKDIDYILYGLNDTRADYPKNETIQGLFESQVKRTPENIALEFEDKCITYDDLNKSVNSLAWFLRQREVKQDGIVAIIAEQSIEMIIGALGALKAGGAYLPIDPKFPLERIKYMLEDSGTKIVLVYVSEELVHQLKAMFTYLDIIDMKTSNSFSENNSNLEIINKSDDLAYVIYTSGTTGKPKGVMIEHRNVVRLFFNDKSLFDFNASDIWTMFHSFCFDFSVWEMYGALLYGGKLVIVPRIVAKDPKEYLKMLKRKKVTILNQTPTAFYNLANEEELSEDKQLNIRYIIFGGEALKPSKLRIWRNKYPSVKLINMYGITETTVHVTYKEITNMEIEADISNIGGPIPTLTTYVMSSDMKLLPIGVAGELCVGGDGVARGYLNNLDLTQEKFIQNPYKQEEKLYKSGDLVRLLRNGEMEYLGRIDHQVKIRGHRIELGEIESLLLKLDGIKEVVVISKKDAESSYLCAYVVSNNELIIPEIREYLSKELPEYMVPAYFIKLKNMPMTSNGKIDRKALPEPDGVMDFDDRWEAPGNIIEERMVGIWQDVLGIKGIGVNNNFFHLGGDSIKSISLISRINKALDTNIEIKDLYTYQNIKELSLYISSRSDKYRIENDVLNGHELINEVKQKILGDEKQAARLPENYEDFYPLSHIQQGMVFYSRLKPEEPLYHDQFIFQVKFKHFDIDLYCNVLRRLADRHQILKTTFHIDQFNEPIQVVHKILIPNVIVEDISKLDLEGQSKYITNYLNEDLQNRFKFSNDLLWRIRLFKINDEDYCMVFTIHHAMMDGWSVATFNTDFLIIYNEMLNDRNYKTESLKNSYKDYIAINLSRKISDETAGFWKKTLSGYLRTKLPFNITGKKIRDERGSRKIIKSLDGSILEALENQSKANKCTLKDICFGAYLYLLFILTGEEDIVTGIVTHDRPAIQDGEKILGCFLNTIPARVVIDERITRPVLITLVKDYLNNSKKHELFLADIARIIGDINTNGNPIFDTIFNFVDFHVLESVEKTEVISNADNTIKFEPNEMTNTLFDLEVSKTLKVFTICIKYSQNYFLDEDIDTALSLYERVLRKFAEDWDNGEILRNDELITYSEKNKILYDYNNTVVAYPKTKTIHKLFEDQVFKMPDNIALVYDGRTMSYRELNEKSNQLARYLVSRGVKSGDHIALISKRRFNMIIGLLGILKCGGAYVPIDPDYPTTRKEYIISNSNVSTVLVDDEYDSCNGIRMDSLEIDGYPSCNLDIVKDSKDLAYIIYTSGSTGFPKGVMIEHHSAVNLINWVNKEFNICEKDTLLFVTSMCFDLSVYDIFGMLAAGGKIVIATKEQVQNPLEIKNLVNENKITFWDSVPSTMNYLMNYLKEADDEYIQSSLRLVFLSGDWIPVILPDRIRKYFPKTDVISLGGATEGTIWSIYYPIIKVSAQQTSIPYGKPIDNNYFYILDKNMRLVPPGVAGELYIGGVGVARGYINNEEKTNASFIKDIFLGAEGGMMYKTGDLGRMLPDGNIEFLGRKDHQVKIRGFRVELGEIESKLLKNSSVKEAVVVDRQGKADDRYLCAYIVWNKELTTSEIREYLSGELPEYMIPTYFVGIEKVPLTSNGKIDRKNLPEPETCIKELAGYEVPANMIEEKLVCIWKDVLDLKNVGIHDNFFELGGHSLKATSVVSRIRKELDIEIPLREVFDKQTIHELAKCISAFKRSSYPSIKPALEKEYYPVSSAQKRLLILNQMEGANTAYNLPMVMTLVGDLKQELFENTFRKLIKRHEILRTSFNFIDGQPIQKINKDVDFNVAYFDTDNGNEANIINEFIQPFDLGKAPLFRVGLINLSESKHILMYDMHHIISDGISTGILMREFIDLYNERKLDELKFQYKDFSEWQNNLFKTEIMKRQEEFWVNLFREDIPVLNISTDFTRPPMQSFKGDTVRFTLDKELSDKLRSLAMKTGTTMYMMVLAVFNILLYKYTGQEDIVIGSPVAGRPDSNFDNIIGMFVNTLPMRNFPKHDMTFKDFLQTVKEKSLLAYENQDYQFEELVEKLEIKRDLSRNPLFDIALAQQNMEMTQLKQDNLEFIPYSFENNVSKFDITLTFISDIDEIFFNIEYCTKLYKKQTIIRMAEHLINIVMKITADPDKKLYEIEILSDKEKQQLLYDFNDTMATFPSEMTIHEIFEKQVEKYPQKIAVKCNDEELTYEELNIRANRLAIALRKKGLVQDEIVAVMVERSIEMIIAVLGTLKAGGAYLPIDPDYPEERIKFMLKDSGTKILLTQKNLYGRVEFNNEILIINDVLLLDIKASNPSPVSKPDNLAYIIYTSGTTGRPKGVMIEHRNVVRLFFNEKMQFKFTQEDVWTMFHSFCFDFSVWEMYGALLYGGKLIVVPKLVAQDPGEYLKLLKKEKVSILNQTPTAFYSLVNEETKFERRELNIRYIIFGGEALNPVLLKEWREKYPEHKLINMYGITETTVHVTYKEITKHEIDENISNIGMPIPTLTSYIMDSSMKLVPIGVAGELYIGGDGVGRGYLNRTDLTAEKFIRNPYIPEERIYRSGDLVKRLPNGEMEYLGRIDQQVKIRGHRVELGEIESVILKYEAVKKVSVIAWDETNGNKKLCAYVVVSRDVSAAEFRSHILKYLPDYMVPASFIQLEMMPITSNGKIDRNALPKSGRIIKTGYEYKAPQNQIENKLVNVFKEVLNLETVSTEDNFFELGGDSIKAIQVLAQLYRCGLSAEIKDIFQYPTIAELSNYIKVTEVRNSQNPIEGKVELVPIQIWFFKQRFMNYHHWNQTVMLYRKDGFNPGAVAKVFEKIIGHHDSLRMVYKVENSEVIQFNRGIDGKLFKLHVVDLADDAKYEQRIEEESNKLQGSIDLEMGPLVHIGLFKTSYGDHLLIVIHHLIIDGVSWRIILEDFAQGYLQAINGWNIELPEKTNSFKEWSNKLRSYAQSKQLLKEVKFWRELENNNIALLPKDNNITERKLKDSRSIQIALSKEETDKLLKKVNRTYNTDINDILLTALGMSIKQWTGENKVLINMEGHGREKVLDNFNISRTVGWFTSIYPLVLDMTETEDLSYQIKVVKENLRRIPHKGIGYGILKYITSKKNNIGSIFNLEPEICFNYLGQLGSEVENDLFGISKLSYGSPISPESESPYALDMNGIVVGGKLTFTITYNKYEYNESTIQSLLECYKGKLQSIINYCINKENKELTPSDLGNNEISIEELNKILKKYKSARKIYSLSTMQQGILFHSFLDKKSSAYFEQFSFSIYGVLNIELFEKSFNYLFKRYDIFCTNFMFDGLKRPQQVVSNDYHAKVYFENISGMGQRDKNKYVEEFKIKDREKGFDLSRDLLMRISILQVDINSYEIIWSHHHILMDGWCLGIITKEFLLIYQSYNDQKKLDLGPVYPYSEYIRWLEEQDREQALLYWSDYLNGYEQRGVFPYHKKAGEIDKYLYEELVFTIDEDLKNGLDSVARNEQVTLNTLFTVLWAVVLQKYNKMNDIIIGSVVSGRPPELAGVEKMVGLFINTIPVRIKWDGTTSFSDLIKQVQRSSLESSQYEYISLAEIQSRLNLKEELVDHILTFENYPIEKEVGKLNNLSSLGFEISNLKVYEQTNYNFNITVIPGKEFVIRLTYNAAACDMDFVKNAGKFLRNSISHIISEAGMKVIEIDILSIEEQTQLLSDFNEEL